MVEAIGCKTSVHLHIYLCAAFSRAAASPPPVRFPDSSESGNPLSESTGVLLCAVSARDVLSEPDKKLWAIVVNCWLYSRRSGWHCVVGQQNFFRRSENSTRFCREFSDDPDVGIVPRDPRLAVREAEKVVSAAALLVVLGLNSLIDVVVPNANTMEKKYARVQAQTSPAKIAIAQPTEANDGRNINFSPDATEVRVNVPITVSGVASGTMVVVDVMRITAGSAEDSQWSRGWEYQQVDLWPEDQSKVLSYEMGHKEYQKIKTEPLNLHIELGLSEYQEADARILAISPGRFVDDALGICRVTSGPYSSIECLKPFQAPGFMATFDPQKLPCTVDERSGFIQEDVVSHAWGYTNHDSFPAPHYSPVADYSMWFKTVSLLTDGDSEQQQRNKTLIFCAGSEIRLARPELKRQVRIQLDVHNVRLEDFASTNDGE